MPRTMSPNSLLAYRQIEAEGLLSRMRLVAYQALFNHGPFTRSELDDHCKGPGEVNPSYHKRLTELERLGVAVRVRVRPCRITGRECDEWDVTESLPVEPPEPDSETLTGDAKAISEIKRAIPEKRRSPELRDLLGRLEAECEERVPEVRLEDLDSE